MTPTERALVFDCRGEPLLGVLSEPAQVGESGVIVIVGGPQYRAGSHRQFVLLARALANAGHAVLRFDYRGMGDSGGEARSFEAVGDDIAAAVAALRSQLPQLRRITLWGLCDGASAALLYCHERRDHGLAGLCLLNPWVRSEASLARTQVRHYYLQRLMQPAFWRKLLTGGVGAGALGELARSVSLSLRGGDAGDATARAVDAGPYPQRMAAAWQGFGGRILLILSGNDYTAKEFIGVAADDAAWRGALQRPVVERQDVPEADHTFSDPAARLRVEALTIAWLDAGGGVQRAAPATSRLVPEVQ